MKELAEHVNQPATDVAASMKMEARTNDHGLS